MHNFKEMKIWQKAKELAVETYKITNKIPTKEQFGIISQLERAAVSVPANIAEGSGRGSNKEFSRFLDIAIGSLFELETEILICLDLNYINENDFNLILPNIQEIQKMIYTFKNQLKIKE